MGHPFQIKVGDRLPLFSGAPVNDNGTLVEIPTSASVEFHLRGSGAASGCIAETATITNTVDLGLVAAGLSPASELRLAFPWPTAFATAGHFEAEFQVTFDSGRTQTFPNGGNSPLVARGQIA